MIYNYNYKSTYSNGVFNETYEVKANSQEEADYLMVHGCATLVTKHEGKNIQSMELCNEKK